MEHSSAAQLLGTLFVMLASARLFGAMARRIGQPNVLGELIAGVIVGGSVLGLVDPDDHVVHALAELGVMLLLLAIGLETDLGKLLSVGGASAAVAAAGVVLPFAVGYAVCALLGLPRLTSIVAGAALTATSVGITARVLSDLGRLHEPEGQVVLGAAVIDDIVGLVILSVVMGLAEGKELTLAGVATKTGIAFGFLVGTLVMGRWLVPRYLRLADRSGTATILAVLLALGLAWLALSLGSAPIIGAFAAGLLVSRTSRAGEIKQGVTALEGFFTPLFFVAVGAAVDLRVFNPIDPENYRTLQVGGLLVLGAVASKFAAGYAPFWFHGRKSVIGVGMIPRGEVGLIFAQMGLASGALEEGLFAAVTLMVVATTFVAPPLLKWLLSSARPRKEGAETDEVEEVAAASVSPPR